MPPTKKHGKAKYDPTAFAAEHIRKNSCYSAGRSIVSGTALLNAIIQPVAVFVIMEDWSLPAQAIVSISIILGWVLFHQIFNAFFDIADAHIETVKRQLTADASNRSPEMRPDEL